MTEVEHEDVPHSGPVFHSLMLEIDSKLASDGIDISGRPLRAISEVSQKFNISIPIAGRSNGMPPEVAKHLPLSDAIHDWYTATYGKRLNIDAAAGRTVVNLDGDLYIVRVPRWFGSIEFGVSRTFIADPGPSRGPAKCNIVQLIQDLTEAKAALLSSQALQAVQVSFYPALEASYTLEATPHRLMRIARGDIATAVECLMHKDQRFGASKWASLQAAEKVLKAALELHGATFKLTHNLEALASQVRAAGIQADLSDLVRVIQCSPRIRYGEEPCSRDEALAALQSTLNVVNRLRKAGAKFHLGIGS